MSKIDGMLTQIKDVKVGSNPKIFQSMMQTQPREQPYSQKQPYLVAGVGNKSTILKPSPPISKVAVHIAPHHHKDVSCFISIRPININPAP